MFEFILKIFSVSKVLAPLVTVAIPTFKISDISLCVLPFKSNWNIFNRFSKDVHIDITATFVSSYESNNVIGYVEGYQNPDSFIILCGHYDHLGKMGDAIFYGANDNASGIAMLLDLAS